MDYAYTIYNNNSIFDYSSIDDVDDAIDFLKNSKSFRSFDNGLIELLKRKNYQSDLTNRIEMADYLYSKLKEINSTITSETVLSWFLGKHSPKIEAGSRTKMYEICFALQLTYEETKWFFQHVYYDRAFNCHTLNEAVFYYAFLRGISYQEALAIIQEIEAAPEKSPVTTETTENYTRFLSDRISEFSSVDELKEFLISNKHNFNVWNQSALNKLQYLVNALVGPKELKSEIENMKRKLNRKKDSAQENRELNNIEFCKNDSFGLILKEIIFDAENNNVDMSAVEYISERIEHKNVFSNNFILRHLLTTSVGSKKDEDIPYVVRNNFPSKKVLSDILSEEKISTSKSYDAIRKTIVLLDFYQFWVNVKLYPENYECDESVTLYDYYIDETDALLYECGYEPLYAGNPYDWIFFCASKNEDPLTFFRSYISDLLPEES